MVAVTADKVVVELEAAYQQFVRDTRDAGRQFEQSLNSMLRTGKATEEQIKRHFDGMINPAKNADFAIQGERAGATFGNRFGVGFLRSAVTVILGGSFLSAIVADARAMGDLEDAARRAGLAIEKMQEIIFTVRREGLTEAQAIKDIEALTRLVADAAQNPRNSLRRLFDANGIAIEGKKIEEIINDLSRLMQNAPEGIKRNIAELSGLSEKWIAVLEKGPEEFQRLQNEARTAGAVLDDVAFRKAEEFRNAWNEATTRWGDHMRETINALLPALNQLISLALQLGTLLGKSLGRLGDVAGILYNDLFNDGDIRALNNQQLTDLLVLSRKVGNQRKVQELEQLLAARNSSQDFGVPGQIYTMPRPDTGNNSTRLPPPFRRGSDRLDSFERQESAIARRIALLKAEAETIGQTNFERDRARAFTELMAAAQKAYGDNVKFEHVERIHQLAEAYAEAAQRVRETKDQWEAANALAREFGNQAISGIEGLIAGTKTLNQVLQDVLRSMANMALKAAILGEGPLATFFGTKSQSAGGVGGLAGILLGAFGGFRARGGPVKAGKGYIVGEEGPEWFQPSTNGIITPNGANSRGDTYVVQADMRDSSANAIAVLGLRLDRLESNLPDIIERVSIDRRRLAPMG